MDMTSIFLSHSTKDKAAAQQIKTWLEAEERGHHVFLDDDPYWNKTELVLERRLALASE